MSTDEKGISFGSSSSFDGSGREEVISGTVEDIVALLAPSEVKRSQNTTPEREKEVRVTYRVIPLVLRAAFVAMVSYCRRGEYLICKCLVHKGLCVLQGVGDLAVINKQYDTLAALGGRYGGLDNILRMLEDGEYEPRGQVSYRPGEFRMASWLHAEHKGLARGTGLDVYQIVGVGLLGAFSRAASPDLAGAAADASREFSSFLQYVRYRSWLVDTYLRIAQDMVGDDGHAVADEGEK